MKIYKIKVSFQIRAHTSGEAYMKLLSEIGDLTIDDDSTEVESA